MVRKIVLPLFILFLLCTSAWAVEYLRLGALQDVTGATSDVGKDEALGVREAVAYVNDTGGINGKPIKLFQYDYGYRVPEAITTYKRFRDYDKVVMVLGWGTGDTEALSPTINRDKMPYLSSSFSGHLCDPKKTPYNFVYATDYSTNARAAITTWYEEVWMKDPKWKKARESGRKPRFVCSYMFASPYASAPIKAIKDQATILGFDIGPDQDVSLTALDTKSQVLGAKSFKPDLVWHGNTTMSVATFVKDAYALGLGADHIVNNWGFDKNLVRLTSEAGEGVIGAAACAFYGMDVPGMDKVVEYTKKINPGVSQEVRDIRTVQGWVKVLIAADAMKIADKKGQLNGEGIKAALETFRNWNPLGLDNGLGRPGITYTPTDHRPSPVAQIYWIKDGKIHLLKKTDMKAKYPDKWMSWMGW
jgi:branched-chain amino acid transport system substrate-binding protein